MQWGLKCQKEVWRHCGCDMGHNSLLGINHQSQTSSLYFFLSLHKDSITTRPRANAKLYTYRNKHNDVLPEKETVSQCEFLMIRPPAEMKVTCSKTIWSICLIKHYIKYISHSLGNDGHFYIEQNICYKFSSGRSFILTYMP